MLLRDGASSALRYSFSRKRTCPGVYIPPQHSRRLCNVTRQQKSRFDGAKPFINPAIQSLHFPSFLCYFSPWTIMKSFPDNKSVIINSSCSERTRFQDLGRYIRLSPS